MIESVYGWKEFDKIRENLYDTIMRRQFGAEQIAFSYIEFFTKGKERTMKKVVSILLTLCLAMGTMFLLTSCGKFDTVKEWVESEDVQKELNDTIADLDDSSMKMEVLGEDDKLIYSYTFLEEVPDGIAEQLESALNEQASTFEEVAASLKEEVDVENPIVVVEYLNSDGSEICSQEFTAE